MPKNLPLSERVVNFLRQGAGNLEFTVEKIATDLKCSKTALGLILRALLQNEIVIARTGVGKQKIYGIHSAHINGEDWRELAKDIWQENNKSRKNRVTKVNLQDSRLPEPNSDDVAMIAKMAQLYVSVQTGPARIRELWDALPKGDTTAAQEHLKLIATTEKNTGEATETLDRLLLELTQSLGDLDTLRRFIDLTLYFYIRSQDAKLVAELKLKNHELSENVNKLESSAISLANKVDFCRRKHIGLVKELPVKVQTGFAG